ncbi:hypothetical protein [Cytobacillus purgationiresistens]|uniref:Uncharacterized protein n=1 Tax=Cytobacillus purgationiresistens TaxID=863449 RepID=A0ABU0ASS4_9BACI|nr:hypothetical protein [Cytobacillus purgationiresistens]MDQ0273095.1 hypothetical protein [Cytobacillus purgationiresistens]
MKDTKFKHGDAFIISQLNHGCKKSKANEEEHRLKVFTFDIDGCQLPKLNPTSEKGFQKITTTKAMLSIDDGRIFETHCPVSEGVKY